MRNMLKRTFGHFNTDDFNPGESVIKEAFTIFLAWAPPAFLFVLWSNAFYPEVEFYHAAIQEGVGPNLWNAIASLGLSAFGMAVIFANFDTPALFAKQILSNTYAIGCLTFGLLVGQWCIILSMDGWVWWHRGLFGITSGLLLVVVFLYNLAVWYLSFLVQNQPDKRSKFLAKLESVHWSWRAAIGLIIALLITSIFLSET